ncbi:adenosine kinase [Alkanindiges sp. WGS2144]|uniref:adenosine kinase n=1 Tax=Alkanindiges sp. WGS2144 TaxID=3366808 RepID=UPI0037512F53
MSVDLYVIGNALVDLEYSVDDHFLLAHQLQKGTMQLAEQATQQQLLANLNQHYHAQEQASGGSAANSTVAFAAMGGSAFYACRVGNDEFGQFYLDGLSSARVQVSTSSSSEGETGTCVVLVTPDGERTMQTYLGITAELSGQQVNFEPLSAARYLYIEGYLATSTTARNAVKQARKIARTHQIQIAITLSDPAMVQYAREGLDDLIDDGVDVLFCNEHEARMYTCTETLNDTLKALLKISKTVIVTRSAQGAIIATQAGEQIDIAAVPCKAIDTLGAGDAFAGAFLYGLNEGYHLEQCGKLAAATASTVVSQYGPRLSVEQYQSILQQYQPQATV